MQKIIFLGYPNAGKTSTKLFLFEKIRDSHLLETQIEPTMGVETFNYNLLDLNIALFDTSGQELDRWFEESEGILESANMMIFFLTVYEWKLNSISVKKYLEKLIQQKGIQKTQDCKLMVFCHKDDLLSTKDIQVKEEIIQYMDKYDIPVFFTSILNGGNGDLWRALQFLLERFSQSIKLIRNILNSLFQLFKFQPLFLMDSECRIIANYFINEKSTNEIIHQVSQFFPNVATAFNGWLQEPVELISFSVPYSKKFIVCLNCYKLHPELGYIFLLGVSLVELNSFYSAYIDLIKTSPWKQK